MKGVNADLKTIGDDINARAEERTDGTQAQDTAKLVRTVTTRVKTWTKNNPIPVEQLEAVGAATDTWATAQVSTSVKSVVTIAAWTPVETPAVQAFAKVNSALISSVQAQYRDQVASAVMNTVGKGLPTKTLRKGIEERYGVSRSRAELIARDQIGKMNGALNEMRQTELGFTEYFWETSDDERARELHAELDGTVQKWADPPITNDNGDRNHPGEDYQCRCTAIPKVPAEYEQDGTPPPQDARVAALSKSGYMSEDRWAAKLDPGTFKGKPPEARAAKIPR